METQLDLRQYIDLLKTDYPEELAIVRKPVDPVFELPAVIAKLHASGRSPALLFEQVKGSAIPVISNLFASRRRIAIALHTTEKELHETLRLKYKQRYGTTLVSSAPVQEVQWSGDSIDLSLLPIVNHNEKDAGPYITGGISVMKDPDTGAHNLGIYRHLVLSGNKLGIKFAETSHGNFIYHKYAALGKPAPIAIVIGHHPGYFLGAVNLNPFGVDEYDLTSSYVGQAVPLVKCVSNDLEVPAGAEIVIEGEIHPTELIDEGPIGEYTGVYGKRVKANWLAVKAITMRKKPIYLDVNSGYIDHQMLGGISRVNMIYDAVKNACPTVKDVYMPPSGCCRFSCYVSIGKKYEGEAKNGLAAVFGADPFVKLAVVVDEDVNIFDDAEVLRSINTRWRPDGNTIKIDNAKTNFLDPTAHNHLLVTKIGIDATKPLEGYPETISVPGWEDLRLEDYLQQSPLA